MASTIVELMRRRFGEKKGLLPSGYTQLEYLQSANKMMLLTTMLRGDKFDVDVEGVGQPTSTQVLLGCGAGAAQWCGRVSSNKWALGPSIQSTVDSSHRELLEITFFDNGATKLKIGTETTTRSGSNYVANLYLFGVNSAYLIQAKVYSIKHYSGGSLVGNFIPCTEDATSKVGLYDIVANNFIEY